MKASWKQAMKTLIRMTKVKKANKIRKAEKYSTKQRTTRKKPAKTTTPRFNNKRTRKPRCFLFFWNRKNRTNSSWNLLPKKFDITNLSYPWHWSDLAKSNNSPELLGVKESSLGFWSSLLFSNSQEKSYFLAINALRISARSWFPTQKKLFWNGR